LGRRRDVRDTTASQQAKKQKSVHKFSCSSGINFLIRALGILPNSRFVSQTRTPARELGRQIKSPLNCEKLFKVNRQQWEYFPKRHGFSSFQRMPNPSTVRSLAVTREISPDYAVNGNLTSRHQKQTCCCSSRNPSSHLVFSPEGLIHEILACMS
jgi:hypothetical protein